MVLTHEIRTATQKVAGECLSFLRNSPSPFHAVDHCKSELAKHGFQQLREDANWGDHVKASGKYYVTRNQSSLIAFTVGGEYKATGGAGGFKIVGAHTDSPCFVLKPRTAEKSCGYKMVGLQTYGGGLWHTWFDRDLSIAGRVVFRNGGELASKLIRVDKPIMRIPNLAIHLTTADERTKGFNFNKETHLLPMLCTEMMSQLVNEAPEAEKEKNADAPKHHAEILNVIARECGVDAKDLVDFELYVYDTQEPIIGGLYDEFIFSARIDNQISCYSGMAALFAVDDAAVQKDSMVNMVAVYDHEEVGSNSHVGASSAFTNDVIRRVVACFSDHHDAFEQALRASFVASVDGVHGVHPNYTERHQMNHRPLMHKGPTIKYNSNQRYATNSVGSAIMKRCADLAEVPFQEVCVKNDSPCGSTIGPIISTSTGILTVDLGNAMLSMHSVREQCGTVDLLYMNRLLESFFKNYSAVRKSLPVE
eukprot:TRINITY_DN24914_c0_g1_i1.p1 TRINITY_DN24914_c0_g1~~TRINITY_DN24914_c0_g1_i1.p1  ORF type:complete len:478 (+),score=184.82 TRINITY_DN24914_c0_g1_i1:63-1496(+)